MSAQPSPKWKDKNEEFAFYRRRDHSNIEALQNLVIGEIARTALLESMKSNPEAENTPDFTMPPSVRHLVSALQGAHGGGRQLFEEFERDYLTIGAQLQFTGKTPQSARASAIGLTPLTSGNTSSASNCS